MASFIGTNKEFRRYIGPRLRNLVQQITRNHKSEIAACEHCGSDENLESAHVRGRDRNEIIDLVVSEYTNNEIITIDLGVFEEIFKNEHLPIEKSILILCRSCHRKYDAVKPTIAKVAAPVAEPNSRTDTFASSEDLLPISLSPATPENFKTELLASKQAEIQIYYSNGEVETKPWNAARFSSSSNVMGNLRSRPEFRSGAWQSKGIVKVHVKIVKSA